MAVEERRSSGNGFLYFAIGALIVGVGVLAWMFYSGETNRSASDAALERAADNVSEALDDAGEAARDAARAIPQPAPQPAPQPVQPATPPN